jgi:single-stranded-DNA-specific exonuclease
MGTAKIVAQVLANRGITDPAAGKAFLNPKLADLHNPELLGGCVEAARRIAAAVARRARIVLYGDYDVDGMAGVAILHSLLRMVGANVRYYVPHRLEEGYGVNDEAVAKLVREGMDLLITVDCGISAHGPLEAARAAGVEVILTDHHSPDEVLPPAHVIVHPAIPAGQYPNADLSGAGVAFKLAWQTAVEICGNSRVDDAIRNFLLEATCLAALGTIADVVPLVGENRSLVVYGLRGLPHTHHPGLQALLRSARLNGERLDAYHVGFLLAPRLNACGRMGHARLAVELLTDAPTPHAVKIAEYLEKQNAERQKVERAITAEAAEMVLARGLDGPAHRAIVLTSETWHGGVIGIVASRLVERFHRPTVLIVLSANGGQGSARSIPGFHMRDALAACASHLSSFGGHAMAGGLRIDRRCVGDFAAAFTDYAAAHVEVEQLQPTLRLDAEARIPALSYPVVEHLSRLAPFGQGNPPPLLAIRGCKVLSSPRRLGRGGNVLSLMLSQDGNSMRAVGFSMGELADRLVGVTCLDVAAEPTISTFNGQSTAELQLKDVSWGSS